nr:serine/threonine protein kinase [Kofleriaceae bacterium]
MQEPPDPMLHSTVGAYRLVRLLGVGGMGRVYLGEHVNIGSRVAIKILAIECSQRKDLIERFFAEARAVNMIRHDNIVSVLDLLMLPDGRPYIVMEFLDGETFGDIIAARHGPAVTFGGIVKVIADVLLGLAAAHEKGIVHRDLKPENIFISKTGRVKVLDFGIAKLAPELGGAVTTTGSLLGTPHYMSPEQTLGKKVDFRADIYAMGVMLYEAVTGQRPFKGDSIFDLMRQHVDAPVPSARAVCSNLPDGIDHIIAMAMAKDPDHRFTSSHVMIAALQNVTRSLGPEHWAPILPLGGPPAERSIGWGSGGSWQTSPTRDGPRLEQNSVAALAPQPNPAPAPLPVPASRRPRRGLWVAIFAVAILGAGVGYVAFRSRDSKVSTTTPGLTPPSGLVPAAAPDSSVAIVPPHDAQLQKIDQQLDKLAPTITPAPQIDQTTAALAAGKPAAPPPSASVETPPTALDAPTAPTAPKHESKQPDASPAQPIAPVTTYKQPHNLYADAQARARQLEDDIVLMRIDAEHWPADGKWQPGGTSTI